MRHASALFNSSAFRTALITLCIALVCALGHRLYISQDMTASELHTLKTTSVKTLAQLSNPLDVEVFINPRDSQLESITTLFDKYRSHKTDITLTVTDPALDPQRMRELDIAAGGEIFIRYQNRTQRLTQLSEQSVTTAIQRLSRNKNHTLQFTTGHGERSTSGKTNADLGQFAQQLSESGFTITTINLSEQNALDANQGTLVIAGPLQRFLANEVIVLLDYIANGGNLIWLTEPDSDDGLNSVAIELGIERLPGVVIDMAAQQLNVERPDFAVANNYNQHQATNGFSAVTLFPQAAALGFIAEREWQVTPLVQSSDQAWTETGALSGKVAFGDDQQEVRGPLSLVVALQRSKAGKQQRVVVAGDGDFIADAWIANGGNRDLAGRLFNWNVEEEAMIGLTAPATSNTQLNLSRNGMLMLAGVAFVLLPALMFSVATGVWYRRQHG